MHILNWLLITLIRISHAQSGTSGGAAGTSGGAAGTSGGGEFNLVNPLGQGATPFTILERISTYLIYISTLILPVVVLYAAFQILTAADNPEKFESGKKTILYAVIGFAIILTARGLVFVVGEILGVKIPLKP